MNLCKCQQTVLFVSKDDSGAVHAHLPPDDYASQAFQQTKGVQVIPLNPQKRRRPYQAAHPTPMLTLAAQNQIHF